MTRSDQVEDIKFCYAALSYVWRPEALKYNVYVKRVYENQDEVLRSILKKQRESFLEGYKRAMGSHEGGT